MALPAKIPNHLGEPSCCERECQHQDCAAIRERAKSLCPFCPSYVDRGEDYSIVSNDGEIFTAHYACALNEYLGALA